MKNLRISVQLVNGGAQSFEYGNGRELVQDLLSNDWAAPPTAMTIEATTKDGRLVTIVIPYDDSSEVHVRVGEIGE